ncbi:MAG: HAMP domain-containing sensor histidine kinase [Myxococcota bacterium]
MKWPRPIFLLGLAGLAAFLVALEATFVREARDGRAQLAETRRALEQYATVTLTRTLSDELQLAQVRVAEVEADPLRDERGLVLVRDGRVLLPRVSAPGSKGVEARVAHLEDGTTLLTDDDEAPWSHRVRLVERLRAALARQDTPGIERAVRESLAHRARFVLPPEEDFAATVALLELLAKTQRPAPELMRRVLRDGFTGEARVEGLQRAVLRAWPRLGADDARFLCARVGALSRAAAVPSADFEEACARAAANVAPSFPTEDGTWGRLSAGAQVARVRGGDVEGTALPEGLAPGLAAEWRERGLLAADDTFSTSWSLLPSGPVAWHALDSLRLQLNSPRMQAAERALSSRLVLKTLLAVVTLLLGVGVVVAAAWAQARRARYLALQSDFVSTVSHELRTPLASMRVMAETLERKLEGHAPAKDYPARLVQTVDGLTFLVENILSFNRLEQGRWQPRRGPVTLASLRAVLEEDAAHAQGVEVLQTFVGFDDVTVDGDGELLRILVLNLLRNAWKYNERSPVTVRWVASREGGEVALRVTDNGVGIPETARESVFEAFHRLGDGRGRGGGGSGLGLAVCRRIAELHGGRLRVASSSPDGTTFELRIPSPPGETVRQRGDAVAD